jgi:hypothetical protein
VIDNSIQITVVVSRVPFHKMDSEPTQSHYPSQRPAIAPEIISKSSPVPHTLTTTRSSRSISLAGWTVTSTKLPICSSTDCDELAAKLGIPVPEMTFGKNSVCIEGPNGWKCDFNTEKALDTVDKTGSQGIKVSYSEQWNRTRYPPSMTQLTLGRETATISKEYSNLMTGHILRLTEGLSSQMLVTAGQF